MIERMAYAYVQLLFALELLFFALSLVLHVSVILGMKGPYAEYGAPLFGVSVLVGCSVPVFAKDGRWKDQIKRCPKRMWRTALILGGYGLLMVPIGVLSESWAFSGASIAFDAISICLLYPVLWTDYLAPSEVKAKALRSAMFLALITAAFIANRAGYLPSRPTQ